MELLSGVSPLDCLLIRDLISALQQDDSICSRAQVLNMPTNPWIAHHKPKPHAQLRLFCFPYAGGGAAIYRTWSSTLPDWIEVLPVQLPGRENRLLEPAFTHMDPLVDALMAVLPPYLDRSFAFFGYSLGAIVGFELARRLRTEQGLQPILLLASARRAPHLAEESPSHGLPDPQFKAKLRELNGTPEAVLNHPELMELMLPVVRSDFELNDTYTASPETSLDCPITVFGGTNDPEVQRRHLEAWRQMTRGPFRLRILPGDHFFIHKSHSLLIQAVIEELERAPQYSSRASATGD